MMLWRRMKSHSSTLSPSRLVSDTAGVAKAAVPHAEERVVEHPLRAAQLLDLGPDNSLLELVGLGVDRVSASTARR